VAAAVVGGDPIASVDACADGAAAAGIEVRAPHGATPKGGRLKGLGFAVAPDAAAGSFRQAGVRTVRPRVPVLAGNVGNFGTSRSGGAQAEVDKRRVGHQVHLAKMELVENRGAEGVQALQGPVQPQGQCRNFFELKVVLNDPVLRVDEALEPAMFGDVREHQPELQRQRRGIRALSFDAKLRYLI